MNRRSRTVVFVALGGGTLAAVGALARGTREPARTVAPVQPATVALVNPLPARTPGIVVSGQLDAWRTATVSAEVAGRVDSAPPQVGERVAAGGLLARLDDAIARATVDEVRAGWEQARAAHRQIDAEFRRAQIETGLAIDAARAQLSAADAQVASARAGSVQAAENARKTRSATRAQDLALAEASLRKARVDENLARTERDRFAYLLREGVVAQQAYDRAAAAFDAARAGREAADQSVSLAREGARQEDIVAASAGVAQADAAVRAGLARRDEAAVALRQTQTRDLRLDALARQRDALAAQETRAAAALSQATIARDKRRIVAPFAGRILARRAEIGELLSPGAPVAVIGDTSVLKATFSVPESARAGLRVGQRVGVTADAVPGKAFPATVHALGVRADARSRTFPLELRLDNADAALLPGMAARLTLAAPRVSGWTLPASALAVDAAGAYVLAVENGRARRVAVTPGAVEGDRVAIAGLTPQSRIVATPQRVLDGAPVTEVSR